MTKRLRYVPTRFRQGSRFELEPEFSFDRADVQQQFAYLQAELLGELLDETQTITLQKGYRQAANEAAGLAWTTPFPLLVFPGLLHELAGEVRERAKRQQHITARSQSLLAEAV